MRFLKLVETDVLLWLLPKTFISTINCLNLCNASFLAALALGHIWLATEGSFPDDGPFNSTWLSSILYAAKTGIVLSNESEHGASPLTLEATTSYLFETRSITVNLQSKRASE